jgi:hypothetical protein
MHAPLSTPRFNPFNHVTQTMTRRPAVRFPLCIA